MVGPFLGAVFSSVDVWEKNKIKQSAYKPSSVPHRDEVSVIYLSDVLPRHFSSLPSDMERAALITSVYMTLQLLRRTARHVAMRLVGSYSTFSPLPLPERRGGYFLLRYSTLADSFLLGSGMLCVARTFLIRTWRKRQADLLLFSSAKIRKNIQKPFRKAV